MVTTIIVISIVICVIVSVMTIYVTTKSYSRRFYDEKEIDSTQDEEQHAQHGAQQSTRQ
jgi:cell division protein FtsL